MISFVRRYRKGLLLLAGMVLFLFLVLFFYRESRLPGLRSDLNATVLDTYHEQLQQKPYDAQLLLRSARHHYYVVRNQLTDSPNPAKFPRSLIERALRNYRRIEAIDRGSLSREDYFFNAYLYYQLGQNPAKSGQGTPYMKRARQMALQSYERGYRSAELMTLLGNLHFAFEEYDVALDYYRSLGEHGGDPQVLFNRAWVHRAKGNLERAEQLLQRALQSLPPDDGVRRQFQLAYARVEIDLEKYREALDRLKSIPDYQNNVRARTLYARSLIGLGLENDAREILEALQTDSDAPREVRRLLDTLSTQSDQDRS